MKSGIFLSLFLSLLAVTPAVANPPDCRVPMSALASAPYDWRQKIAYPLEPGSATSHLWATSPEREKKIKQVHDWMRELQDGEWEEEGHGTPPITMVPVDGVKFKYTPGWDDLREQSMEVYGVKDGVLRATILLPVGVHNGNYQQAVNSWQHTDTYSVYAMSGGKRIPLVTNAKSLGMVTAQEIEIPLVEGQPVTLMYDRSGSGGPHGYPGGRVFHITWKKGEPANFEEDWDEPWWWK